MTDACDWTVRRSFRRQGDAEPAPVDAHVRQTARVPALRQGLHPAGPAQGPPLAAPVRPTQ